MDLRKILLISLGHLSCDLNGGALPSLMPYLAAAHGFNYQAAGALMFAYSATSSLVQPVFGYLADKHARSWFVPLAVLLAGGSLGLVGFLDSYWAIFLTLMLCGVGGALFHPEGARYANLVSGNRKGAGMSIFSVGGNSGFVVGPLLVAGATCVAGLHGTAVFLLLALCTASFLFVQMRGWQQGMPRGRTAAGQAEPRNDWHAFGVLTLVIASRSILFLGFNTYIPMYWHDVFGQSKEFGAMMLAFFCVCGVSSNVLGGFLADRIGYARIIRLSWWLALPAALAFAWVDSMWLAALLLAPLAVGLFAPFSSMVVLGQKLLARNMGFASGVTLGLPMTLGGMAMPLLGWIADNFGGLGTAMACLVPVAALGALASLRRFDLPLAPRGTPFQLRVWRALQDIPYGRTCSYSELAAAVGDPRACRAVGRANGRNPLMIVIPCHRVIAAGGGLGGYSGGLEVKRFLLRLEAGLPLPADR